MIEAGVALMGAGGMVFVIAIALWAYFSADE